MNSFFPDGIKAWNNVIGHFQTLHLLIPLKVIPYLFFVQGKNIHDSIGLRYLLYLGVSLSPLRNHKNRHEYLCNHGIEDNGHFQISCSFFTIQRATLRANAPFSLFKEQRSELMQLLFCKNKILAV